MHGFSLDKINYQVNRKLSSILSNSGWNLPNPANSFFHSVWNIMAAEPIPNVNNKDHFSWGLHGREFSVKEVWISLQGGEKVSWFLIIWESFSIPKYNFLSWRIFHSKIPTQDYLQQRGFHLASICPFCKHGDKSMEHLLFQCQYAT